jgi:hypothetical protein
VTGVLQTQKPESYFGAAFGPEVGHNEMALLWGNGRLLIGALEYYGLHPSAELLASARRFGDFLLAVAPKLNSEELRRRVDQGDFAAAYICWTQQMEGLVELSRVTGDRRTWTWPARSRNARTAYRNSMGTATSLVCAAS